MFVDVAKVKLEAGKGGDGAVSFAMKSTSPKVAQTAATAAVAAPSSSAPTKTPILY